jgi:peptidoglycan/LPS O-acetylase OafA/YrhL
MVGSIPLRHDRKRLLELDALRGLAAAGVMFFHYFTIFPLTFPSVAAMGQGVRDVFAFGSYGVLLFFAISGFVISLTLKSTRNVVDFAVRRAARLYPVYWAALFLTVIVVKSAGITALDVPIGDAIANLTMIHGLFYLLSVDGVYWTLLVELCFYGCMATLWASGALRWPERVAIGWLGVKILCWLAPDIPWRLQALLVAQYIPFFLIGILCHRIWNGERTWRSQHPYLVACLMTVAMVDGPGLAVAGTIVTVIMGAAIGGWARFLQWRPLLWLGSISYALYLIHDHVGFVIILSLARRGVAPWAAIGIAAIVAIILAALLRHYVERPAERMILGWWKTLPGRFGRSAAKHYEKEGICHVAPD